MMGGGWSRMGRSPAPADNRLSADDAVETAQRWLDGNLSGSKAIAPTEFYGYYTLFYTQVGKFAGMLSVHGQSGDVWVHSWHGEPMGS